MPPGPVGRLLQRVPGRPVTTSVAGLVGAGLLSAPFLELLLPPSISPEAWPDLLFGLWIRVGLLALAAGGMAAHAAVIRSPRRPVLQLLPVSTLDVVQAELGLARQGVLFSSMLLAALTVQLAWRLGFWTFLLGVPITVFAGFAGLWLGGHGFLFAVEAAEDPRWAALLDLVRGATPRAQAALVWALAPVVLVGGAAVAGLASLAAAVPVGWAPPGEGAWAAAVLAMVALVAEGLVPWQPIGAHRAWFRASVVLEDIRARYASVEKPEDALWVPQQHHAEALGGRVGAWMRLELRQGHRNARAWLSGAWLVVLASIVTVWTDDPTAPPRAAAVLGLVGWVSGGAVVQGAVAESPFLRGWLGMDDPLRSRARAYAVFAWSYLPVLIGGLFALRHGPRDAALVAGLGLVGAAIASVGTGFIAGRPRAWLAQGAGALICTVALGVLGRWIG